MTRTAPVSLFQHLSIKWKLIVIILVVTTFGLLLSSLGLAVNERVNFRRAITDELTILADVIGSNSTGALSFSDEVQANEALSALRANQHITLACIYDTNGGVFARYRNAEARDLCPLAVPTTDAALFRDGRVALARPILLNERPLGTIFIQSDTQALASRLNNYVLVSTLLFLGTLAAIFLLSVRLQRWITEPIADLVTTMRLVSREKNYALRAEKESEDELGTLVEGFNEMLSEIQTSQGALAASEARTRMVLDTALDAVVTMDADGRIASWNPQAEAIFGWTTEEALGAMLADLVIPEEFREAHRRGLAHYLVTGDGPILNRRIEVTALRKDGSPFPAELSISPVDLGTAVLFGAFIRDITARKEAEQALKHYAEELERSNKELDDFAYIASHDLKEPLRGIHNFSNLLLTAHADQIDDRGRSKLETLARLTQRMETLIDSLLYFSRVGRTELAIVPTDLNAVLDDVLASLEITIREHDIEIRHPHPLPTVRCDQVRVAEVFRNLITNAIKYNDKPEKWIEIGHEERTGPDGASYPVFYVRDNGIGIREKHRDTIFQIFKRLHGRDQFGGGTGIGMTIIKKIIERHEGLIWVESIYGEGSTFYFTLQQEAPQPSTHSPLIHVA